MLNCASQEYQFNGVVGSGQSISTYPQFHPGAKLAVGVCFGWFIPILAFFIVFCNVTRMPANEEHVQRGIRRSGKKKLSLNIKKPS